jgi:hypothetical protein
MEMGKWNRKISTAYNNLPTLRPLVLIYLKKCHLVSWGLGDSARCAARLTQIALGPVGLGQ